MLPLGIAGNATSASTRRSRRSGRPEKSQATRFMAIAHIYIYDARHAALALLMSPAKRPQMSHRGCFEGEAAEAAGQWLCYIYVYTYLYACRYMYSIHIIFQHDIVIHR